MLAWIKQVFSDNANSSFGRILSLLAFSVMVIIHVVLLFCHKLNAAYIPQLTDKLFLLASLSYGFTKVGDISKFIFNKTDNQG